MNLFKLVLSCFAAYTAARQLEIAEERLRIYKRETSSADPEVINTLEVETINE